jgi:hypothetical protein
MGRSPALVMYIIQKAKMRYALEVHAGLIEELRVTRAQAKEEKEKKEAMLDNLIKTVFGSFYSYHTNHSPKAGTPDAAAASAPCASGVSTAT